MLKLSITDMKLIRYEVYELSFGKPLYNDLHVCMYIYIYLSSTWGKFDPNTAYVVCISVSLGFNKKNQMI